MIAIAGDYGQALLPPELLTEIVPHLEDPSCRVIGHDLLPAIVVMRAELGRRLKLSNLWDVRLAMQLLNNGLPTREDSLPQICSSLLRWHLDESPRFVSGKTDLTARELDYASRASGILERIYARQRQLIEKNGLSRVAELEFDALPALAEIEYNGIGFDKKAALQLQDRLILERGRLEKELEGYGRSRLHKGQFNPKNPQQVKNLLHSLGYHAKTTSAADLERILLKNPDDQFVTSLLKYRKLRQNIAFLKSWTDSAQYSNNKNEKNENLYQSRIYPKLEQLGGRSGRITCSLPNIHQVPRDPELKGLFIASPGMSFVEADFSAIEMRIIAVLSGDEAMIKIFKKGLDPHKQTARAIFQKSKISEEERQIAKTLNYGTVYGGGANMVLAQLPHLTEDEAREFLHRFYDAYPGLESWQRKTTDRAVKVVVDGAEYRASRSALGRIRYVDPNHRNALINTPVQASGSDLQKMALGRVYQRLNQPKYTDFRLINAVHDSILLEVPDRLVGDASRLLQEVMEKAGDELLKIIPCTIDVKTGKDWSFRRDPHRSRIRSILHRASALFRRGS
ncbi:MAG: DNA polymerase [Methanothrix sp.]|uniref:DNA polymerase n=1 Tax=Methanothrix sp. TaxID=90426 RepID=UPI002BB8094B|nr:DNA polymerase [Methanothrix sp.]MDI9417288.1 DNA polymerase [Euryarchaeota archaeon]HON35931.1 DNA polymerase [Methanothrix sp.]HRU75240.1 DNA polymerase [Methanothrix sp.]